MVRLAEACACGYSGDAAALHAIRLREERKAAQHAETARQRIAEIEAAAAADHRAAEGMALARMREQREPSA